MGGRAGSGQRWSCCCCRSTGARLLITFSAGCRSMMGRVTERASTVPTQEEAWGRGEHAPKARVRWAGVLGARAATPLAPGAA